jgi:hypothetical protein
MSQKVEVEKLMNELLAFAEKMLGKYGEFHPFGGYTNVSGRITHVGVDPSSLSRNATAEDRENVLTDSLISIVRREEPCAVAMVTNVSLKANEGSVDAIRVFLEHELGYCADVFLVYELDSGAVRIVNTTAQQGEPRFFNTAG